MNRAAKSEIAMYALVVDPRMKMRPRSTGIGFIPFTSAPLTLFIPLRRF